MPPRHDVHRIGAEYRVDHGNFPRRLGNVERDRRQRIYQTFLRETVADIAEMFGQVARLPRQMGKAACKIDCVLACAAGDLEDRANARKGFTQNIRDGLLVVFRRL